MLHRETRRGLSALRATQAHLMAERAALKQLLERLDEQSRIAAEMDQADMVREVRSRQVQVSERVHALLAQLAGISRQLAEAEGFVSMIDRHKNAESQERVRRTILAVASQAARMAEMEQVAAERLLETQARIQALEELNGLSATVGSLPGDGGHQLRKLAVEAELIRLKQEIKTQDKGDG